MVRALAMTALLAACSFHSSPVTQADASPDAPLDGLPDARVDPPNSFCFGAGLDVRVCLSALPTTDFHVTANRDVITTSGSPCSPEISKFCVIAGTAIQIDQGKKLGVSGTRPLVLISTSTLGIDGILDVASHLD